jgi:hypothetical protein
MRTTKEIKIDGVDRKKIRHELINIFLDEEPGKGRGELCAHYRYDVETLKDGKRIFLKRPARLNKGFDFEVHVEDTNFGKSRWRSMPTHGDIYNDLYAKMEENPDEFEKIVVLIERIYSCEAISDNEIASLHFVSGYPIEMILKVIKWLFIEQDMTYWNWSGREMFYSHLNDM